MYKYSNIQVLTDLLQHVSLSSCQLLLNQWLYFYGNPSNHPSPETICPIQGGGAYPGSNCTKYFYKYSYNAISHLSSSSLSNNTWSLQSCTRAYSFKYNL